VEGAAALMTVTVIVRDHLFNQAEIDQFDQTVG
jgi:hypothetical protein